MSLWQFGIAPQFIFTTARANKPYIWNSKDSSQIFSIGHDNKGGFAGWYLEKVTINIPSQNCKLIFQADRWLAKGEGDGKVVCDLFQTKEDDLDMLCEMPVKSMLQFYNSSFGDRNCGPVT